MLRNVETMSFADIEKELNSLAAKVYIYVMGSSYMSSSGSTVVCPSNETIALTLAMISNKHHE